MYEINVEHTAAVLENISSFTRSENIGVVLCGPFTSEQKEKVLKKTQVNTAWVLEAFQWLKLNNRLYKNIPIPNIEAPTVLDNTESVQSENSDIEIREEIRVVFPDSTIKTGGCQDGTKFDQAVAEIRAKCANTTPFLTSRPSGKILRDYEEENLMRAFPLQFPFGYGYSPEYNKEACQNGFLKHLLSLSIPAFHESAFVLTVHNMYERSKALTGAIWQVMGRGERCDVSEVELNSAISNHCLGLDPKGGPGENFLNSVRTVKKNMGHTNAAAQAAQSKFISLTHHFGCAKVLFTVSFDDSMDLRITALSGKKNIEEWLNNLDNHSPEYLSSKMDELESIRYKYPGLCALNFEWLLDIILDKIVGDNNVKCGLFGKLAAYGLAVEEQGRKTLHAHILVYTTDWNKILHDLHSSCRETKRAAEKNVIAFMDKVLSTELTPGQSTRQTCPTCKISNLEFANEQTMRNLRHRVGCRKEKGVFARCPLCQLDFQGDSLAMKRSTPSDFWSLSEDQLKAKVALEILKATLKPGDLSPKTTGLINYRFNHHLDRHTKTCFKKGDEGRCFLPDIAEAKSCVIYSEDEYETFDWKGRVIMRKNVTTRPNRLPQDAYTNTYCKMISGSKAPSNSNVGVTTGARSTIYTSCYLTKNTQKEDSAEFKKMGSYAASRWKEIRKESTLFEGLSRLMGAVLVNTGQHVCSAPMAAYLVRNGSRFRFSETFKYIPAREVIELLCNSNNQDSTRMNIMNHERGCFLSNEALNYLLRPAEFEEYSLLNFFQEFEVVRMNDKMKNQGLFDIDNDEHPGYQKQAIRRRKTPVLAQFSQWIFPDAASFGGNIMQMENPNSTVESYCRAILVLCHPLRNISNICVDGSFHKKFKTIYHNGVPSKIRELLSNVQMFYNSMRLPAREDPLNNKTTPFSTPKDDKRDEEEDQETDNGTFFDGIFDLLDGNKTDSQYASIEVSSNVKQAISLASIRKEGARGCGFLNFPTQSADTIIDLRLHSARHENIPDTFITNLPSCGEVPAGDKGGAQSIPSRDRPTLQQLMNLTFRNTRRRLREPNEGNSEHISVEADGTVLSIIEWSTCESLNLDKEQQLSFQIATAAFVLTYYDDARYEMGDTSEQNGNVKAQMRHSFISEKTKLRKLARLCRGGSLRMFLDGAGGSGKSRVVSELMKYARQYTSRLNLTFDMRTIVVTALSGVAATSIGGETLHSAAGLNSTRRKEDLTWANVRLLIIDEVSFMNTTELENLDDKLRDLTRKSNAIYGGLHVLFCGDFRQLEPCTGQPLYSRRHMDQKWSDSINCYIELQGLHRFKEDLEWGLILQRIRRDSYTQHDIDAINQNVTEQPPAGTAYCVYMNADRVAINAGVFSEILQSESRSSNGDPPDNMLIIKASNMRRITPSGKKIPLQNCDKDHIYETCGDYRLKQTMGGRRGGNFVDPLLKLYYHAPLMLVANEDVPNGHANGTRVILESVVLKGDECAPKVMTIDSKKCLAVEAAEVQYLICTLDGNSSKMFKIQPKKMTCIVKAPIPSRVAGNTKATINFRIELLQLALLTNNATTGHKLQGQTKQNLVISVWSKRRNWNYVALSRVKTRNGLHLIVPLPYTVDFSIHQDLKTMMEELILKFPKDIDWDLQQLREEQERCRRHFGYPREY